MRHLLICNDFSLSHLTVVPLGNIIGVSKKSVLLYNGERLDIILNDRFNSLLDDEIFGLRFLGMTNGSKHEFESVYNDILRFVDDAIEMDTCSVYTYIVKKLEEYHSLFDKDST